MMHMSNEVEDWNAVKACNKDYYNELHTHPKKKTMKNIPRELRYSSSKLRFVNSPLIQSFLCHNLSEFF